VSGALDRLRSRARRRTAALSAALCAHAVFVAALLWQADSGEHGPPPTQPLDVQLVRLPPPAPVARAAVRPVQRPLSPRETAPAAALPVGAIPPTASALPKPDVAAPPIASALRAGLGCSASGALELTANERRHCQARFVAGDAPVNTYAVVGRAQQGYFDASAKRALWWQQPFLATDPKTGCRPKVTNQQAAIPGGHGSISDWRVTMGCAVSF
jgi:hypothetical protein